MDTGQVIQRLQDLDTELVRALSKVQNGIALCWTKWMTSIGQVVGTRVLGKLDKWTSSRVAWANWSFVMKAYDGDRQDRDRIANVLERGDFSFRRVLRRTMQG